LKKSLKVSGDTVAESMRSRNIARPTRYEDIATCRLLGVVLFHPTYGLSKNHYPKAREQKADGNYHQYQVD
jgi:hypothetical protein